MNNNLKTVVYGRLEAIANAEKITKAELGHLSRELLIYVPESHDIDIVNRLLGVLTPMNRRVSIMYFRHFLPWEAETDNDGEFLRFGKMMSKEKQVKKRLDEIAAWLSEETNNLWVWSDHNVEIKQKDFRSTIKSAIKKALKGDEKSDTPPLTHAQIVETFFEAGISVADLVEGIAARTTQEDALKEQAEKQAANTDEVTTQSEAA